MSAQRTATCRVVGDLRVDAVAVQDNVSPLLGGLQQWLAEQGVRCARADDVVLCAAEALTNVVRHAYRDQPAPGTMELAARRTPAGTLVVDVIDTGQWRTRDGGGDGLRVMQHLADSLVIDHDSSTRVTARYSVTSTS